MTVKHMRTAVSVPNGEHSPTRLSPAGFDPVILDETNKVHAPPIDLYSHTIS